MSTATEIDMDTVEIACGLACEKSAQMASLYEQIGDLANARNMDLEAIFQAVGKDMIASGQRTKRIGGKYVVEAAMIARFECLCHGVYLHECPDPHNAAKMNLLRELPPELVFSVRSLSAASKDDAS